MKKARIILYIIYVAYVGVSFVMGFYFEKMIHFFGLIGFLTFFQKWIIYGNLLFIILLIWENINVWGIRRKFKIFEKENIELKKLRDDFKDGPKL